MMLTSVVQVLVNIGVALALENMGRSIVARKAVAGRPSVKLEATRKAMVKSKVMDVVRKSPMAVNNLPGMNARNMAVTLEATAVSSHNTVLTLIALVGMVVRKNQATAKGKLINFLVMAIVGNPRFDADVYSSGGYGRSEGLEYGGERPDQSYGASGVPGGFDEEPRSHGRRRDDDDEYGERRQEYGSGGYGEQGYGRRY